MPRATTVLGSALDLTEESLHGRRRRLGHAGRRRDVVEAGGLDLLQAAEVAKQLALALGPDAGDVLERRAERALLPELSVKLVGEAVRLVAEAREEKELRRARA